ncbi:MAG: DUF5658 family protein [Halanaerobiales bacterium]
MKLKRTLILLTILNLADYVFTQIILMNGGSEANPLLQNYADILSMGVIKLVVIPILIYIVWKNVEYCNVLSMNLIKFVTGIYCIVVIYHMYILRLL